MQTKMAHNIIILNSKERKLIRKQLEKDFEINTLPEKVYFCINEKDNVYIANKELFDIDRFSLRASSFGLRFGSYDEHGFLLSVEGTQLVGEQATKNIIELNEEEKEAWTMGEELSIDTSTMENQIILIKHGKKFFGSAKAKKGKIKNTLPKARILKHTFEEEELQ